MTRKPKSGVCALCRNQAELLDSHLMPAGAYKLLREPNNDITHPILVTAETTVQTPAQVHDYLLCADCELRFEQRGEDWVLKNQPHRNGRFPMREYLLLSTTRSQLPTGLLVKGPHDPLFDVHKLIYFAASVFWRSSVHHWSHAKHLMSPARLPDPFEEQLRLFLLDKGSFPPDAILIISLAATYSLPHLTFPGALARASSTSLDIAGYGFAIPGIQFRLQWGDLNEERKKICATKPPHAVLISDRIQEQMREAAEKLRPTSKLVGSLKGRR